MADALDALRAAVAAAPSADEPLALIEYRGEDNSLTDNLVLAETIVCLVPGISPPPSFPKAHPTRVLKSAKAAQDAATTPESTPDAFLPLEALVFAIQTRSENLGAYVRQATGRGIARLAPTERAPVLEYLLGKTQTWSGVVPLSGDAASQQALALASSSATASVAGTAKAGPARSTTPPIEPPAALKARFAASHAAATTQSKRTAVSSSSGSSALKRAYVPSRADADFVKRLRTTAERSFLSRADALHGTAPWQKRADFSNFRNSIQAVLVVARKGAAAATGGGRGPSAAPLTLIPQSGSAPGQGGAAASSLGPASGVGGQRVQRKQRAQDPIILLSNSFSSLINMFNVKKLLEEGVYVSPEAAKKEAGGMAEAVVQISHVPALVADALHAGPAGEGAAGGGAGGAGAGGAGGPGGAGGAGAGVRKLRFLVVDNADALHRLGGSGRGKDAQGGAADAGEDVWNRVVAVFTTGQTWQFKSYKYKEPRELFKHAMGVHVRYTNEQLPPVVRDWNITQLQIEPSKRHTDKQLVGHFWRTLEAWMMRRKPFLMPVPPS